MTEEEKEKFRPAIEELKTAPELLEEGVKRRYNFNSQFAMVVGVLFGVLAAFNSIGENKLADLLYIIGISCCALSFVLCIICLYQPIHSNQRIRENKALKAGVKLMEGFLPDDERTKELKIALEETKKESFNWFKLCRICSYVLFAASLVTVLLNIYIRYFSIY